MHAKFQNDKRILFKILFSLTTAGPLDVILCARNSFKIIKLAKYTQVQNFKKTGIGFKRNLNFHVYRLGIVRNSCIFISFVTFTKDTSAKFQTINIGSNAIVYT